MTATLVEKGERFRALHARPGAFVVPNPWDAGTARILAGLGFEALTTTSGGLAFALGRRDGSRAVTREETLVLVGRAENYLHGRPDLADTIRRLRAYEAAGADCLFAPGLAQAEDALPYPKANALVTGRG